MRPDPIRDAADAVRGGGLIVMPTDTVYGIGSRPDDPGATARLFEAKQRSTDLELPILCPTVDSARRIGAFDDRAEALAAAFWPGALTLVVPRTPASEGWDLGGDPTTVGLRLPAHPLAAAVLALTGPMAVTSANRSGQPPLRTCDGLAATFGDQVAVYLCEDAPSVGAASTVLDLAHGSARVIRAGGVDGEAIRRVLPPGASLLDSRPSS